MIKGSYRSWDSYTTGQLVDGLQQKKENRVSLNGNGIMLSFLGQQFYRSTLYIDITDEEIEIILMCRKSIHTDSKRTWIKSYTDVPMGSYDSAQIMDLIGVYRLDTFGRIMDLKQVGLYRDDCLIFRLNSNNPKISKIREKIMRAFKLLGFRIEITSNLKIVNFLDIRFNLKNNTFKLILFTNPSTRAGYDTRSIF